MHIRSNKNERSNSRAVANRSMSPVVQGKGVLEEEEGRFEESMQGLLKRVSLPDVLKSNFNDQLGTQTSHKFYPTVAQRTISGTTMALWNKEHNQTIPLESGSKDENYKSINLDRENIAVNISEHASNHFVNRHTIKEFSFKDENIKTVNSFWAEGEDHDSISDKAETVAKGLEPAIKEEINNGGGAVHSKKNSVSGLTVGYNITLDVDADSYDDTEGKYSTGHGNINMFYPEGDEYDYYSSEELKEIRDKLQKPPYNKTLQLKTDKTKVQPHQNTFQKSPVIQRYTIEEAEKKLIEFFTEPIFQNFKKALESLEINLNDIPNHLIDKLENSGVPHFYLPTTEEIWKQFITKIIKYEKTPLKKEDFPKVDYSTLDKDERTEKERKNIVDFVESKSKSKTNLNYIENERYGKLEPLVQKIVSAKLTSNFALDTLIKYASPHMLNAFEIKIKSGHKVQNIQGELEQERVNKEKELFNLKEDTEPIVRPRYAALNFHDHAYGAAARNDYGLCHFVFKDHVKTNATFTCGDTFDTLYGVFPLSETGAKALITELAKDPGMFEENLKLLQDKIYKPDDTYFDVQIHQDIDIRNDVSEIIVSKAEMNLFNMNIDLVDKIISNLTQGIFVRSD